MTDLLENKEPYFLSAHDSENYIGIAPLIISGYKAHLLGDPDLCDYLDLIVAPGKSPVFLECLLRTLSQSNIRTLDLFPVHPESIIFNEILPLIRNLKIPLKIDAVSCTYEMQLPPTWGLYLKILSGHQRHEVRRKMKRAEESGLLRFQEVLGHSEISRSMDCFIEWFRRYHSGKALFMDLNRERFFRELARNLEEREMLRLFLLEINQRPAAMTFCMEYRHVLYLYNNAYDPGFKAFNTGTLSKVLSIREGIYRGLKSFSFLKGEEPYKRHLGGRSIPLYRIIIDFG
jgi:CelD/BcsL family acetyltransferase involved in cellulose biosynthesis